MKKICMRKRKEGYTIIIAVIIMAVLLIIGVAVLTSAANSLNSVNRRVDGRQAYYVAKSAINVIDESMHGGELGNYVRDKAYADYKEKPSGTDYVQTAEKSMDVSTVLSGDGDSLKDFSIENLKVAYSSTMRFTESSGTGGRTLDMKVAVSFTAKSGDESYKLDAAYEYSGSATVQGGNTVWGTQTWKTTDVSQ